MGRPVTGSNLCFIKCGVMAALSKMIPSEVQTGVSNGVSVRAQQSKGSGRVADEWMELEPLRRDWLARCSRADWYCFSFWRLTIVYQLVLSIGLFGSGASIQMVLSLLGCWLGFQSL